MKTDREYGDAWERKEGRKEESSEWIVVSGDLYSAIRICAVSYATSLPTPTGSFQNGRTVLRCLFKNKKKEKEIYYTLRGNLNISCASLCVMHV